MANSRRKIFLTVAAAALMAIFLPLIASAQGSDPWNRDRRDDRDYRWDRDYGNRYDGRMLRDSARRLKGYAHQLQRDLDYRLDHSDEDGTRHEDRLNDIAKSFRDAASDFSVSVDNERDFNRSAREARRILDLGNTVGRRIQHHFDDYRIRSDWQRVSRELRVIEDIYGFGRGGYYGNDAPSDRRRDDQRNNLPWWRRLP